MLLMLKIFMLEHLKVVGGKSKRVRQVLEKIMLTFSRKNHVEVIWLRACLTHS